MQTYSPTHPALQFAAAHDYIGFAAAELADRRQGRFPPACALIYLGVIGRNRAQTLQRSQLYAGVLGQREGIEVLGPAPYPIARMNDEWRFRIAVKGKHSMYCEARCVMLFNHSRGPNAQAAWPLW